MITGDRTRGRQALDALVYAVAITAIAVIGSIAISFAFGGKWLGVKYILFLVGIGLFGIGTLKLRPSAAWSENEESQTRNDEETWLQARIQHIPPLDRYGLRPNDRLSNGAKLFLASVLILLASFSLEIVFGVTR